MPLRIDDFEFDEHNEAEMARHGVTPAEVFEVLSRGPGAGLARYQIRRNRKQHAENQPYVMIGATYGGRMLLIPIKPLDELGLWRPATAFDQS